VIESLRAQAEQIFRAGVAAADPALAVRTALQDEDLARRVMAAKNVRVLAIGKAACKMANAVSDHLGVIGVSWDGIVVVNRENRADVDGFRVLATGHPLPDADGVAAAAEVARFVSGARDVDLDIVLISGGGSAILPAPAEGLTLADKLATTDFLLACGAPIHEINTVRKHSSYLKGGGLARLSNAAHIETLILSDVVGDDLSTIASGPTVGDPTSFADARDILARRGIFDRVPESVRARLEAGIRGEIDETPEPGDAIFGRVSHRIVGSNGKSLDAAADESRRLGYHVEIISRELVGEAREVAQDLARQLEKNKLNSRVALLAGGETTVTLRGGGRGGRNQEMALAFARASRSLTTDARAWAFASAGTDGIDGPTDAAGAIVDEGTVQRGVALTLDVDEHLSRNDSYTFLEASGDLLMTGATGTNVADLQVLLVE
jgi:hydroxypyruvate reductase